MTPKERRNHKIINGSRRKRIAKGSGTSVQQVNQLLKQYVQTRKMMKGMKNSILRQAAEGNEAAGNAVLEKAVAGHDRVVPFWLCYWLLTSFAIIHRFSI